jgi:hypothetical protein
LRPSEKIANHFYIIKGIAAELVTRGYRNIAPERNTPVTFSARKFLPKGYGHNAQNRKVPDRGIY